MSRWPSPAGRGASEASLETTADTTGPTRTTDLYVTHRNLLVSVAYEILGSASDAEDVLQETWLRWSDVDQGAVQDPRAYFVRIMTRQALNRLRSVQRRRRRETYTGPWLPEPLVTAPDVAEDVELAERVSLAMMLVLETLTPLQRAVFVLREVFDFGFDEIAASVDRSPAAVRQLAHRARNHVDARRPRRLVSANKSRAALASFRRAAETGDVQGLLDVLAPDVVLIADGGGVKSAALRPILGADKVARYLGGPAEGTPSELGITAVVVNGEQGLVFHLDGELDGVMVARVQDGRIAGLYYVRNPEKLERVGAETGIALR